MTRFTSAGLRLGVVLVALSIPLFGQELSVPSGETQRFAHAPRLNLGQLHMRWSRSFPGARGCRWEDSRLEAPPAGEDRTDEPSVRLRGTIGDVLDAAARDTSVCGPTIFLAAGTYVEGELEITKPTVLVGEPGVVIIGGLRNTTGAPMWLQTFAMRSAPSPGALIVSHPKADSTVIDVDISNASGFGVVHHGGRLEAWNLNVDGTRATPLTLSLGPTVSSAPGRSGYPGRYALGSWLAGRAARREVMGAGLIKRIQTMLSVESFLAAESGLCSGTGLFASGGAYVELYNTSFSFNESAGLAARGSGTWVNVFSLGAALNGFAAAWSNFSDAVAANDSSACFGGVDIADHALLLGQGGSIFANSAVGLFVRRAVAGFAALSAGQTAESQSAFGIGDDVLVYHGFISLSDQFSLIGADRAGLLMFNSSGNAIDGVVSAERFGLVLQHNSKLYLNENVDFSGGEQDILTDGDLPVPEPPPVPQQ